MISKHLESSLNRALRVAQDRRHQYATVEHLLLALLENPEVSEILLACGCDIPQLARDMDNFLATRVPMVARSTQEIDTIPTVGFQRVIQRAVHQVQNAGKTLVTGAYVLAAILNEKESHAVFFLEQQNVTKLEVQSLISHGVGHENFDSDTVENPSPEGPQPGESRTNPLALYAVNLNQQAREGRVDPLIGRDEEIVRACQILCRRRKNNPLFVGDAGVGKTHVVEGLALRIVNGEVPELLRSATLFALDMGAMLAGTKFRGDFEARMKGLLRALQAHEGAILFIDEIHTVIGAGSTTGSVMDASNLLKPLLASGQLRCIGSTTFEEYRGIFEKDRALARRFQKIDLDEPDLEETVLILKGLKARYEEHHEIKYSLPALRAAAELSRRHIHDRRQPDAAIDVLDEAGAANRLLPVSRRKKSLGVHEVEQVVARMAKIPPRSVSQNDQEVLKNLDASLKRVIFGQEGAIERVCEAIKLSRSGLGNPERPIGAFLFSGPTGVGKTELARQLARELGITLTRFDMSEYMERHTVSRLIGAPPGYVGFDQGGLLTDAVTKNPHCVLLLDEIEKAHPDVFNLLLQVMDHGRLTDNNGRPANFRQVILVMTTNAGASDLQRPSMGFVVQDHASDEMKEIQRLFAPEFRNRLDAIVPFSPLGTEAILRVVDKFLLDLEAHLENRQVDLAVEPEARQWLADHGYDKSNGARPMERLIKEKLRRPLADELLFGKLLKGGSVSVSVEAGQLALKVSSREEDGA
ncbi:MAG: ATP-dependent Clp protease ATP-binding subunit ClpA [Magnetococcales bacterium]|nr:ATP-dependent Clp protease ATP-binding subunit ClpA [Magnetococcales bacterium]